MKIDIATISVTPDFDLRSALAAMNAGGAGMILLIDENNVFLRTITDGDLRRALITDVALTDTLRVLPAHKSTTARAPINKRVALDLMNEKAINLLPLLDAEGRVQAVLDRAFVDKRVLLSTPHIGDAEQGFVAQAFETNWVAPLGPNVDAFEAELASFVGVGHAAALSSGTAAIHLALRILGVKAGDFVLCSSLTFAASAFPIAYEGATPVFVDSDLESWNISPVALERSLSALRARNITPKAIVVVNLYGQSADMDPITEICERYGVPIVEDAAESLGATYKGRASGTLGRIGVYSFNGNKIITTSGGGMLVSDDGDLVQRARFLATQAREPEPHYEHKEIGFNYRMSNILAGVGRGQLSVLNDRVERRREIFETYRDALADVEGVEWMPEPAWSRSNRWLTTCTIDPGKCASRGEVARRLADDLIEARPVWKPMHRQPVFSGCEYFTAANNSNADRLFDHGLCLPSGSNLTEDQLDRVIDSFRKSLKP